MEQTGETKPPKVSKLLSAAQAEAYARSVMGGGGRDPENQKELDESLGKSGDHRRPEDIEAWELLGARKISVDEFKRRTNTHI